MTLPPAPSPAPAPAASPAASAFTLLYWTVAALVLTGGLLSAVMFALDRTAWLPALLPATLIGLASGLAGILPVLFVSLRNQPRMLPMAYLAGTGLRMMAFLALLLLAVYSFRAPTQSTAVFALAYTLAAMAAEVAVLVRGLSKSPRPAPRPLSTAV